MYEKLVESLRNCVADENGCCFQCPEDCNGPCQENLMTEAADAIEELSAFKTRITDGCLYCMKDGILYQAKVAKPSGKVLHLPPIEFLEPPKEE